MSIQEIIDLHMKSYRIIESALSEGDYKTNNREVKKLRKLKTDLFENNLDLARKVYGNLLLSDCVTAKSIAAVECLRLNILIQEAIDVLECVAKRNDVGISRHSSEMALRIWRGEVPGKTL